MLSVAATSSGGCYTLGAVICWCLYGCCNLIGAAQMVRVKLRFPASDPPPKWICNHMPNVCLMASSKSGEATSSKCNRTHTMDIMRITTTVPAQADDDNDHN